MAAVCADDQLGADLQRALRGRGAHSDDPAALLNQSRDLRLHPQMKGRVAPA